MKKKAIPVIAAAGIVVGRVGTSVVKVEEIIEFYEELDESSIM